MISITDTLRVSRGHLLHLFRQSVVHRESSRCRPIPHIATQTEEFGCWKKGRYTALRELLLREVEGLCGAAPNPDRVLQKIGEYIHGDGAWPSNVSCRGYMPRRISIVSRSYMPIFQHFVVFFYLTWNCSSNYYFQIYEIKWTRTHYLFNCIIIWKIKVRGWIYKWLKNYII